MDTISVQRRSANMRAIRSKNTKPEMVIRRLVHSMGYRYRLHRKDLPGKPDLVFLGRRKVLFLNGCFWHGHDCKRGSRIPKTNIEYWGKKIARNKARDAEHEAALQAQGWRVLVIWECQTKDEAVLKNLLKSFLESSPGISN
jgi:DNA mismatch endonuclease (patch repair protein)